MAIRVTCSACGKTLLARESAAGRKARCPDCDAVIDVPESVSDADEVPAGGAPLVADADELELDETAGPGVPPGGDRRPCPMCGEMILTTAAKCRYCGEVFDAELKRQTRKQGRRSALDEDENLSGGDWVLAIVCSGIGCIMGIIWMIQRRPKGFKMFGISLLMQLFWGGVRLLLEFAKQQAGP